MWLTRKLFGLVYKAFDRNPDPFAAFRVAAEGGAVAWSVSDGILTLTPPLPMQATSYDLTDVTISALVPLIGADGYSATLVADPESAGLAALVLLDGDGPGDVGGTVLYGYSNPNWAYFDAVAAELQTAKAQIPLLGQSMATTTAQGEWLDLLGSYYVVPRLPGEADAQYSPRIPAEVLCPKGNNVAIEAILEAAIGQPATVTDVEEWGPASPAFDGSRNFDGSWTFNATATPIYNLFDVSVGFDLLGGSDILTFQGIITGLVNRVRVAGTFLRALVVGGSSISDTAAPPTESAWSGSVNASFGDAVSPAAEAGWSMVGGVSIADTTKAVTDQGTMTIVCTSMFDGTWTFSGAKSFMGGLDVVETIEGVPTASTGLDSYQLIGADGAALLGSDGAYLQYAH